MNAPTEFEITPDEVLDYGHDATTWLESGDTLASSTFSAEAGVTVISPANDDTTTSALFSGMTVGDHKRVTNIMTTINGLTVSRSFMLLCVPYRFG